MAAAARRLRAHLGRRGTFLLVLGVGKTCFGMGLLISPPDRQGLMILLQQVSMRALAWVWIAAGLVTFGSAWVRIGQDMWGFLAALVPPSLWAFSYAWAAIDHHYSRGAWVAVWFLTSHIGVILWASTVPEHSVPHRARQIKGRT